MVVKDREEEVISVYSSRNSRAVAYLKVKDRWNDDATVELSHYDIEKLITALKEELARIERRALANYLQKSSGG